LGLNAGKIILSEARTMAQHGSDSLAGLPRSHYAGRRLPQNQIGYFLRGERSINWQAQMAHRFSHGTVRQILDSPGLATVRSPILAMNLSSLRSATMRCTPSSWRMMRFEGGLAFFFGFGFDGSTSARVGGRISGQQVRCSRKPCRSLHLTRNCRLRSAILMPARIMSRFFTPSS
jgi:hypothetical protein